MGELIDRDGEDHEDAGDEILVDNLDADQGEPIAEDAHDHGADEGSDDASPPAEKARAAEHHSGDAVQVLCRLARVRITELRAADEQERGEPCRQTGERVDAEEDAIRVDTRQPRCLGVVADRIDVPPPGGLGERTRRSRTARA